MKAKPEIAHGCTEIYGYRIHCFCHSFITDGKIKYLSDCNHHLAGQTIDLPKIE